MESWIIFAIGYALGFVSPVAILLWMGRKQIREAMKPFKVK